MRPIANLSRRSIDIAARAGISCQGFFIFGLPGETAATIEQTIQFAKASKLARAQFLILDVLPGSQLWSTLQGQFAPNWSKNSFKEPEWVPQGLTKEYLLDSLAAPDEVRRSMRFGNARLLSRWYDDVKRGKHVVVVVVSEADATNRHWIITAYLTRRLVEGEVEWKQS